MSDAPPADASHADAATGAAAPVPPSAPAGSTVATLQPGQRPPVGPGQPLWQLGPQGWVEGRSRRRRRASCCRPCFRVTGPARAGCPLPASR